VKTDRNESAIAKDVLVGEVWLGSGQSNMSYAVNALNAPPEVLETAKEEAKAAGGAIRYFSVTSRGSLELQDDVKGAWVVVVPNNVGACSAVAWNFAVILREHIYQPIGLIVAAVGGTPAEAWISKTALDSTGVGAGIWKRHNDAQKSNMVPTQFYNGKIHGLAPYTLKGIIWFQSDGNERHPEEYPELITTLIKSWRATVPDPKAVRYAWAANPILSVENAAGLPLRPFRTDSDPMLPYRAD